MMDHCHTNTSCELKIPTDQVNTLLTALTELTGLAALTELLN